MSFIQLLTIKLNILAISSYYIYIGIAIGVVALFFIILSIYNSKKRPKKTLILIDDKTINDMILHLGGIGNIVQASKDGARLSFKVRSTSKCNLTVIKESGALGIFVTGTTIKMMFPYDATPLIQYINQLLRGEN